MMTVAMLFVALPIMATAATTGWEKLIYFRQVTQVGSNTYYINSDLVIYEDVVVPEDVTLYLMPNVTLATYNNSIMKVAGEFIIYGNVSYGSVTTTGNGKIYYQYGGYPGYGNPWYPNYPGFPTYPTDTNDYWYWWAIQNGYYPGGYYPGGYLGYYSSCATPSASVSSGSTVTYNTQVTLTTTTSGASIYYTTNGSAPDQYSTLYTGPISINKNDMTIRAIAVKSGMTDSAVAMFNYKIKTVISFTDLGGNTAALTPALITLVQAKIIPDGTTLNPDGSVSYDELIGWLRAVGIDTSKALINEDYIKNKDALSFEDLAYVSYRVLIKTPSVLTSPKYSSKQTLSKLVFGYEVTTTPSILRAAVMSLVEADLFYNNDFHPQNTATRAYAFYMLANVYNEVH